MQYRRVFLVPLILVATGGGCARILNIDDVLSWKAADGGQDNPTDGDSASADGEAAAPVSPETSGAEGAIGEGAFDARADLDGSEPPRPDATDGIDASHDSSDAYGDVGPSEAVAPPRLIAPLSTSTVTSQTPTLRWVLPQGTDGVVVEICRDRSCTMPATSLELTNATSAKPGVSLSKGIYFWRAYGRRGAARGVTSTPTWQFTVPARSAPIDTSWGTVLDFNGDGHADVAVGSYHAAGSGRTYAYDGSKMASGVGAASPVQLLSPTQSVGDLFGSSVASAGDIDGDGYADVVVGAKGANGDRGLAFAYFGGDPNGLPSLPSRPLMRPVDGAGQFGTSVASAGDVNGDGYADIVVGGFGGAYVFFGGASGPSSTPDVTLVVNGEGYFGWTVAGAGDVNGDGYGDVVVGTAGRNARAYVYLGAASGLSTAPAIALAGPHGGDQFSGCVVSGAGDVNGDGYADVAVQTNEATGTIGNASQPPTSPVYVYVLGASGPVAIPATVLTAPNSAVWPTSTAGVGDVNGDGYADVVVGASYDDRVFLHQGGPSGLSAMAAATVFRPDGALTAFGASVAGAGDIDGDGLDDIVIGAVGRAGDWGAAYVYRGGTIGSAQQPFVSLAVLDAPVGNAGISVASARLGRAKKRRHAGGPHAR